MFVLSLFIAGCNASGTPAGGVFFTGMPNPWIETDAATFAGEAGFAFAVPENAEGIAYRLLKEAHLSETIFYMDGGKVTARVQPSKKFDDISGMYFSWTKEHESSILGFPGKERFANDGEDFISSGIWYDKKTGRVFSFSHSCAKCDHAEEEKNLSKNAAAIFANAIK